MTPGHPQSGSLTAGQIWEKSRMISNLENVPTWYTNGLNSARGYYDSFLLWAMGRGLVRRESENPVGTGTFSIRIIFQRVFKESQKFQNKTKHFLKYLILSVPDPGLKFYRLNVLFKLFQTIFSKSFK